MGKIIQEKLQKIRLEIQPINKKDKNILCNYTSPCILSDARFFIESNIIA